MNLNVKKTKCIAFQKKNKTNKKDTFMYGNKEIESVSSFNYFGMTISGCTRGGLEGTTAPCWKHLAPQTYAFSSLVSLRSLIC